MYINHAHSMHVNFHLVCITSCDTTLWVVQQPFTWTIHSFAVLDIIFRRGVAIERAHNQHVLFNAEGAIGLTVQKKISCTKWCFVTIEEITYLVVWKFDILPAFKCGPTTENESLTIADDNTKHILPFKVLGVSYKNRQIHLKCASEKLERNEEVQIKIEPDPDNDHDKNAIAVLINYGSGWIIVGYIPSELTCYLHPLIESNSIVVTISHILLRVIFMLTGYYLTINITRKGQWCPQVITASKRVK